jgi:hypothetical protein
MVGVFTMVEGSIETDVVCPEITVIYTGLAIREYLMKVGKGSPADFYRCFKKLKPTTSYQNVVRYFYLLKRAGVIEPVETVTGSKGGSVKKTLYRIVPGREDDDAWLHPQQVFYPETRLGARRYRMVKKR